jgi:peptidoglycan/LPS O-acetylase OafA/YrhL
MPHIGLRYVVYLTWIAIFCLFLGFGLELISPDVFMLSSFVLGVIFGVISWKLGRLRRDRLRRDARNATL